jgi:3-oxoacyl-[acyl-carrier protein] reductase
LVEKLCSTRRPSQAHEHAVAEEDAIDLGLEGQRCIVTGASRGIGAATALTLASEGCALVLAARSSHALRELAQRCLEAGAPDAETVALDVAAPDAAKLLVERCRERLGGLEVLVNGAGATAMRPLDVQTDEEWQGLWELHVMAPLRLMRAAAPQMAELGYGRIVNVCSIAGRRPSPNNVAYSATKAAELSVSRAFADAYAARGVLVNAVNPGAVAGALWLDEGGMGDQIAAARGVSREQVVADVSATIPLGRFGSEEEIAAVIVFLCSRRASNVTGAAWSVDGGMVPTIY